MRTVPTYFSALQFLQAMMWRLTYAKVAVNLADSQMIKLYCTQNLNVGPPHT